MPEVDALMTTAEVGAVYTMLAPEFAVVVPEGIRIRVPLVFATQQEESFKDLLDTWIRIKRADGTIDLIYDHWILGKTGGPKSPRWSVLRDVLGWVE